MNEDKPSVCSVWNDYVDKPPSRLSSNSKEMPSMNSKARFYKHKFDNKPSYNKYGVNSQKGNVASGPESSKYHKTKPASYSVNQRKIGAVQTSRQLSNIKSFPDSKNKRHFVKEVSERNSNNYPRHTDNPRPIGFRTLEDLVTKSPNELLLSIHFKNCGFSVLLKQQDIRPDMMGLALIALGKSCLSDLKQVVSSLISTVSSNTDFLIVAVPKYLVSLRPGSIKPFHLDSLFYLTSFLQRFQHTLPSSSSEIISILYPLLKSTCEKFLTSSESYDEVNRKLDEIQEQNEIYVEKHTQKEIKKQTFQEKQQLLEPPENFRSISILPNADDVNAPNTFLRKNIVKGKYMHVEHYLDIQYRLLREDYVRPLREGIADYLRSKKLKKPFQSCRDVRVYSSVHIVKQDFVNGGMVHIAQFPKENFKKIKWEYSKRFLTGSLLCFSSDDFQTMLFASVARRLPEELKKGLLLIRFEELTDEVLNLTPLTNFVIIETTAYFEAYRYNLRALHELNEENLPLKQYIIDVEKNVDCPVYLHEATTYDMRPLLIPLEEKFIKHYLDANGDKKVEYIYPSNIADNARSIQVLNESCWPSETDLNLDHSQYLALNAAITKEFTIIQGPPGTGKTYIGLRIVQLLLHNIDKWRKNNSLPVLVVCYTNHALDQFLEGLMLFTNKIVRIGGRGTNDKLLEFQLSNLKRVAINKREIPKYLSTNLFHKNHELKSLKLEIDKISISIRRSLSGVLGEDELRNYISDSQYYSLRGNPLFHAHNLKNDGFLIHDWLGIRSRIDQWNGNPAMSEYVQNIVKPAPTVEIDLYDDDVESIGEGDIEFIEAQRDVDSEEFAGISFDIEDTKKEDVDFPDDSGWQVQGGKKKRLKYIKKCLENSEPLVESVAMKIRDVWCLNLPLRWQLYKFWIKKYITGKQIECMHQQQQLKELYKEICEIRTEEDIFVLQKAHVVGMTTTGAAKYRDMVLRLNPTILIVEEAAEILESHVVTSLAPKTQHVILIGDHQQLRPSPTVYELAVKYGLNISLFERMIKNEMECFRLSIQHRMRPDVADLIVPHIYTDLHNHESVTKFENIKGVSKNVFFVTHNYNERQENDSKSKQNEHEAKFLVKLCKYFVLQGYDPSKITVLTTYSGQLFVMKKLITDTIRKVKFTVVDNFQGEENDIILISFVRSNEEGEIGFLKVSNRVCVALSRAKKGLYCIGNFEMLAEISDLWKNIVHTLHQKQAIGPSLQLMCQNHPGVCNIVANEKDFDTVPEGGCSRLCEYRLICGHVCSLMCHPYDKDHEFVRCYKECNKTCEEGHKCHKKCYQNCGSCIFLVPKKMYTCGHTLSVPCHKQKLDFKCFAKCEKVLSCGHKCSNSCSDACVMVCKEIVTMKSPMCGHDVNIECCSREKPEKLMEKCKSPCSSVLECGHICWGTCSSCHQARLHVTCNEPCKRILVCGHECKSSCSNSCPPCTHSCENRCFHSKCPKKCGEPCDNCTEQCQWSCKHKKCSQLCGEICNRIPCNEPCLQLLPCKHPCIGFCGEPCPKECRECNSESVNEIFFGTEEDESAKFVCLEDCNHILEISGITQWMKPDTDSETQIQMKACPKCKTVIRRNLRFGNIVKDCLMKIEKVKQITYGNLKSNEEKQSSLLKRVESKVLTFGNINNGSSIFECWVKVLSSKIKSIQQITCFENVFNFFIQLSDILIFLKWFELSTYISQDSAIVERITIVSNFMNSSTAWILDFIQDEFLNASEQQLQQLMCEIKRLKLGVKVLKLVQEHSIKPSNSDFENCIFHLSNCCPFGEKDMKAFSKSLQSLARSCGNAVINISDVEKQSILKAMGLAKGHWYQCPNGHVYCITECGGAMEKSKCSECNATIGGTQHQLLNTNRVATEMDGARFSAWSDNANMGNYDIDPDEF